MASMHEPEIKENKLKDEIFNLNKDPNEIFVNDSLKKAIKIEEDEDSFDKIVDDSSVASEDENEVGETFFRRKHKTWLEEDLTENKEVCSNGCAPLSSSGFVNNNLVYLNKYPDDVHDFGFESEDMNKNVLSMLKIYFDIFY